MTPVHLSDSFLCPVSLGAFDLSGQSIVVMGQAGLHEVLKFGPVEVLAEDELMDVRAAASLVAEGALLPAAILKLEADEHGELDVVATIVLRREKVLAPRTVRQPRVLVLIGSGQETVRDLEEAVGHAQGLGGRKVQSLPERLLHLVHHPLVIRGQVLQRRYGSEELG